MATDAELAKMPISEAVRQPGGNGLASPHFKSPLNFFDLFGWQHIETGVEALICDGELVESTRYTKELARLFGRRRYVRRVLLKPAPLEIAATSLTADQLELTLTVAVKYEVSDAVYVASLQDPLAELTNLAIGVVAEYIRTRVFTELVADEGAVRAHLQERLSRSPSIEGKYVVYEVLKALPSGDERLIEVERKTRAAKAEAELTDATGQNKLTESNYQRKIDQAKADLQDDLDRRKHERELERMRIDRQTELAKAAIVTAGEVAKSGMDPTKITNGIVGLLIGQVPESRPATTDGSAGTTHLPLLSEGQARQGKLEHLALASIKDRAGIVTYEVIESRGRVRGAVVQMLDYEIAMECNENYPTSEPAVTVRYPDGRSFQPKVLWISGVSNSLAQVVLGVIPQAQRDQP